MNTAKKPTMRRSGIQVAPQVIEAQHYCMVFMCASSLMTERHT